jgi:methionine synthase II (cobalamin-independent)
MTTSVHLVGSVGLETVDEVFTTVGKLLGSRLKRIPDGEPGGRRAWISWQYPLLMVNPFLRIDENTSAEGVEFRLLRIDDGVDPKDIRFGELGYAREARASYQDFLAAREKGILPRTARFQVSLPTPTCVVARRCVARDLLAIEAAYEKEMIREVQRLVATIPHKDLCIQWDMTREILWLDGQLPGDPPFKDVKAGVTERLMRICSDIPEDVELGFHICYGDANGRHFVEPKDTAKMVELANAIAANVAHPVAYFHMPVPIARDDEQYFAPLTGLQLSKNTELYLGLVHAKDGVEGTHRRMKAARKYVKNFGIASECGICRAKRPETVMDILKVYAGASED